MKRRDIIKSLSILPLAGGTLANLLTPKSASAAPSAKNRNLFQELGVRTFINAAGTLTFMTDR
jgi:L-seryl-tRNA(Ser) seleniumtransferase